MTKEQVNENQQPAYEVDEEEEESVTIDFENKTIYQKEEGLILKGKGLVVDGVTDPDKIFTTRLAPTPDTTFPTDQSGETITAPVGAIAPPEPTFKDELQDLLLNSVTSKAIASLLSKHYDLDTDLDKTLNSNRRMGQLNNMIAGEVQRTMDKHRQELRACYVGSEVRYEKIPVWAKAYVKDYIRDMIHGLAILVDDGE